MVLAVCVGVGYFFVCVCTNYKGLYFLTFLSPSTVIILGKKNVTQEEYS